MSAKVGYTHVRGWDATRLKEWREKRGVSIERLAEILHVSIPTAYRIEAGQVPHFALANRVVLATRGYVRYRDIYLDFRPEYA